ncbi:helix-turn-helix domain-containing protein [Lelliottia amnigena]|uniref:Helix-turn-helix domain-containing protein n=1 Tax=Lelliottia amnigena TaxID=61646 RepID=A0AAP2AFD5_LELAM|nr:MULTISPECIES: YdaS family helix-turn-helix protein [Enterobacteriaceae]MBL5899958.1 helix-turn-helix domain-containing protein [Lelliottia amnigena]MBL5935472.1 helix-turn-helix domain-containing protein [Lelliottia amnigena]NTZ40015.1 helix-turn-helix domain-containing protein [Enterobacter sp. JMULE2]
MNRVIKRAISIVGSQKELAKKVGVDQSAVSKWLRGGGIRSQYIPGLVAATNGQLTAVEIIDSLNTEIIAEPDQA